MVKKSDFDDYSTREFDVDKLAQDLLAGRYDQSDIRFDFRDNEFIVIDGNNNVTHIPKEAYDSLPQEARTKMDILDKTDEDTTRAAIASNEHILSSIKKAGGIYSVKQANMNDEHPFAIVFDYYGMENDARELVTQSGGTFVGIQPLMENGEEVGVKVEMNGHENELSKIIDKLYNTEADVYDMEPGKSLSDDVGDIKIVDLITDQEVEGMEQVRQFINNGKQASIDKKAEEGQVYSADVEDLLMLVDNTREDYLRMVAMYKNLSLKKKNGTYDVSLAPKLFMYLINDIAKKWYEATVKWDDDPKDKVLPVSKQVKEQAAKEMVARFEDEYENEQYDFMKHKEDGEKKASSIKTAMMTLVIDPEDGTEYRFRGMDGTHVQYQMVGGADDKKWSIFHFNQVPPEIKKQLEEKGLIEGNFFKDEFYEEPRIVENISQEDVQLAKSIIEKAEKQLGHLGGEGEWALTDLLADNTNWSLTKIDDVLKFIGREQYRKKASIKQSNKSFDINLPGTNLNVVAKGLDTNGNFVVNFMYPNSNVFSIQTNGVLPETDYIMHRMISELSEEEKEVIKDEVVEYINNHGTERQKTFLKVYNKRASTNNAYDVYLNNKKIDTVFYSYDDSVEQVKKSLVDHDGYDPAIVVKKRARTASIDKTASGWTRVVDGYEVEYYEEGGHNLYQLTVKDIDKDEYIYDVSDFETISQLIEDGYLDPNRVDGFIKYLKEMGVIKQKIASDVSESIEKTFQSGIELSQKIEDGPYYPINDKTYGLIEKFYTEIKPMAFSKNDLYIRPMDIDEFDKWIGDVVSVTYEWDIA